MAVPDICVIVFFPRQSISTSVENPSYSSSYSSPASSACRRDSLYNMPTISVDKAALFKELGRECVEHDPDCMDTADAFPGTLRRNLTSYALNSV